MRKSCPIPLVYLFLSAFSLASCNRHQEKPKPVEIVKQPEDLGLATNRNIQVIVDYVNANEGRLDSNTLIAVPPVVREWYEDRKPLRTWSNDAQWNLLADSLLEFIGRSEYYGMYPEHYHYSKLRDLRARITADSLSRLDAALWARADVLLTDAFFHITRDIKYGRLIRDSITLRKDTVAKAAFYLNHLAKSFGTGTISPFMDSLEPSHQYYRELKMSVGDFLDSMDRTEYTFLEYPYKDSVAFARRLQTRLFEGTYIDFNDRAADSTQLAKAIAKVQQEKQVKVDGKAGPQLVRILNNNDVEKFRKIAINLDRYKLHFPDSLPERYLIVNIPGFRMQLWDTDTINLESRVIVGQPKTRTPVLTSEVSNFITYPQWTVPYSIIFKEMLPRIRRNVEYLDKENLMVIDRYDSVIDPRTVNWNRVDKDHFPYLLKQRQGDDNSLGIIKFNFRNKYSVYLHDTNARWLFSKSERALSHGCVRVQQWEKLAKYLIRNDSTVYRKDTLSAWIGRQERHFVYFSGRIPIYIRYFTCEVKEGRLNFYEDIYGEDKMLRGRYIAKR